MTGISWRSVREIACSTCGRSFPHVSGFVDRDDPPLAAAYQASGHTHEAQQAAIDVTLGTWHVEPLPDDHETFSCYLRPDSAMAVDATVALTADATGPVIGRKLTRDEALAHPRISDFWRVVDVIGESEPVVHDAVYHRPRSFFDRLRGR